MNHPPSDTVRRRQHWDAAYETKGAQGVSWYQPRPQVSLDLIDQMDVAHDTPVIDVGGGESMLVDNLVARGFVDLTVLDISTRALSEASTRVGSAPVRWLAADVRTWRPDRQYGLWHDRAVFHFLVDPEDRAAYLRTLGAATARGSVVVVATFALGGPETCSGLPVARYSPDMLVEVLGEDVEVVISLEEQHTTPTGAVQPFTWVAGLRR